MTIYYYVYRITNIVENKHYYGKRKCNINPTDDLGKLYFSSSKDKRFKEDQKNNPQNYKYKVIKVFDNNKSAVMLEIYLHAKFDVAKNPKFYNRARQTSVGFDTTNMVSVKDKDGNKFNVPITDERYLSGDLVGVTKGMFLVTDAQENIFYTTKDDTRFISGELKTLRCGWAAPDRIFTDTHRENLSKASKGVKKSPDHVRKIKENSSDRVWIYNKDLNQELLIKKYESIPDGWIIGRLIGSTTGKKWCWNPETYERVLVNSGEQPPNNFIFGRGSPKIKSPK